MTHDRQGSTPRTGLSTREARTSENATLNWPHLERF